MPDFPPLVVRAPPPLLFVSALVVGLLLDRAVPLRLLPTAIASYAGSLSAILFVAGGVLIGTAALCFWQRRTTLIPTGDPSSLVVDGPFRLTRNPIYVSFALVVVGVSVWRDTAWPVVLLPAPLRAREIIAMRRQLWSHPLPDVHVQGLGLTSLGVRAMAEVALVTGDRAIARGTCGSPGEVRGGPSAERYRLVDLATAQMGDIGPSVAWAAEQRAYLDDMRSVRMLTMASDPLYTAWASPVLRSIVCSGFSRGG